MDIYRLASDIKLVNQVGVTLNIEERMKLELQLLKITEANQTVDEVVFWGKITGIKFDYYIALGLTFRGKFEFPTKKFFWARSDNFEFEELPEINQEYKKQVDTFRNLFSGDPKLALIPLTEEQQAEEAAAAAAADAVDAEGDQKPVDSDEEDNVKVKPKAFTELDRLAYVVRAVENDCSVVPIGAYKLTPSHELRHNDSFRGLSLNDVQNPASYQHFRAPQSQEKQKYIAKDDALFHFDFFDPITTDLPKGSWSVQTDSSKTNATVRSLLWPGFVGFHKANSNIFGYTYIGNGLKNCDLPFLL